jgi:hypothetical protein
MFEDATNPVILIEGGERAWECVDYIHYDFTREEPVNRRGVVLGKDKNIANSCLVCYQIINP